MRNYSFPLAAALALLIACSSQAAEKPRPAQGNQNQPKKVWTNDDMDQLRSRGLISIAGQEPTSACDASARRPVRNHFSGLCFPARRSRLVCRQAADLQAELDKRLAALQQEQQALALAKEDRDHPARRRDGQAVRRRDPGGAVA